MGIFGRAPAGSTTVKPLPIGAGGFCLGIDIANDGTRFTKVDIFGAWKWAPTSNKWELLTTNFRMPGAAAGPTGGCYEIRVAPSNSNIVYAYYSDYTDVGLFKSRDGGCLWQRLSSFGSHTASANASGERFNGPKMAVDPINPAVVYVGTPADGVFFTTDGGATWAACSGITNQSWFFDQSAGYNIVFDQLGGSTGGRTNNVYVCSPGNGVYHCSTPGGTFSLMSGSPVYLNRLVAGASGVLYGTDQSHIYKMAAGVWSTVSNQSAQTLAVDPANTARIAAVGPFGAYFESSDSGGTWSAPFFPSQDYSADVPWINATIGRTGFTTGEAKFDPSLSNTLLVAYGLGVCICNPNTTAFTYNGLCRGIENLTFNRMVAPKKLTKKAIAVVWDQGLLKSQDPSAYPTFKGPTNDFSPAWSLDYSVDGSTLAAYVYQGAPSVDRSAVSSDQGESYTPFAGSFLNIPLTPSATSSGNTVTFTTTPPAILQLGYMLSGNQRVVSISGNTITFENSVSVTAGTPITLYLAHTGGNIAVSTASNMIICPSDRASGPFYTLDGGATWNPCNIADTPTYGTCTTAIGSNTVTNVSFDATARLKVNDMVSSIKNGWDRRIVTAIHSATSFDFSGAAATFSGTEALTCPGVSGLAYYSNAQLICADKVTPNVFYAVWCRADGNFGGACYRSTDGGATWTKMTGSTDLQATPYFIASNGTTKAVPSNAGYLFHTSGNAAFLRSRDSGATWASVPGITGSVGAFGFGAPKPGGGGHSAVYVFGTGPQGLGLYRSDDCDQLTPTWNLLLLGQPLGALNWMSDLDGDKNLYGWFYGAYGHAAYYGYLN